MVMVRLDRFGLRVAEAALTLAAAVVVSSLAVGCSAKDGEEDSDPSPMTMAGAPAMANAGSGAAPNNQAGGAGMRSGATTPPANQAGAAAPTKVPPPPEVMEMLDPNVDWTALTLVYPSMYSAFDGKHTFQVPVHVDGATVELSDWMAIPSSAVSFDADPDTGGVLVTVLQGVAEITIAVRTDGIGGTAPLHVTTGKPEQWEMGTARYANGVEFDIPDTIDLEMFQMMLLDPNWMPPKPPADLACNNCHSTGAKYFEVQHTPTQAARFSDDDLRTILTMGKKPAGVGFRVLPKMIFGMTAEQMYAESHRWEASDDEITGLIIYLRSLTPQGQGDILLPDGTYVAPGEPLPGLPDP